MIRLPSSILSLRGVGFGALLLLTGACTGDDAGTATTDASASSSTASSSGSTAGTAGTATDTAGTTAGSSSSSSSSSSTASTTGPETTGPGTDTGTTTTEGTTDATTSTTTDATTSTTTDATTDATTGGTGGEAECKSDKECMLFSDCCTCDAIYIGEPTDPCAKQCLISTCESLGVQSVSCRLDHCVAERLKCDDSGVVCDAPVPQCDPGYLPEVNDGGTCYTGGCVPVHLCDYVPDCTYCDKEQMCVVDVTQLGPLTRCEPVPAACAGEPTCECAGKACDHDPYDSCSAEKGVLSCSCPQC